VSPASVEKPRECRRLRAAVAPKGRSFDFEDAREAYRYVDRGEHRGKVVVSVD